MPFVGGGWCPLGLRPHYFQVSGAAPLGVFCMLSSVALLFVLHAPHSSVFHRGRYKYLDSTREYLRLRRWCLTETKSSVFVLVVPLVFLSLLDFAIGRRWRRPQRSPARLHESGRGGGQQGHCRTQVQGQRVGGSGKYQYCAFPQQWKSLDGKIVAHLLMALPKVPLRRP